MPPYTGAEHPSNGHLPKHTPNFSDSKRKAGNCTLPGNPIRSPKQHEAV
jgi:hypothetical protein